MSMNKLSILLGILLAFISCSEPTNQFSPRTVIYSVVEKNHEDNNTYDLDIVDGTIDTVILNSSEILKLTFFERNRALYYSRLIIYRNKKNVIREYTIDKLLSLPDFEIDSLNVHKISL
jgi:hypothetical protein